LISDYAELSEVRKPRGKRKLFWKERSKSKELLLARLVQCSACMYWLRKKTSSSININLFLFFFFLDLNPDLSVFDRWAFT